MNKYGLDNLIDRIEESPETFAKGEALSSEDRSVIDPRDVWVVDLVNSLTDAELKFLGAAFAFLDMKHYLTIQKTWFDKEKELMKARPEQNGKEPNDLELIEDAEKHRNMERYKLCYVLEYPHKVAFDMGGYRRNRYEADLFIAIASKSHRIPFPYFEQIWCNTLLNQR